MLHLWPQLHRESGPFVWSGNCVPDSSLRTGRAFRIGPQAETASRIRRSEWDSFSGSASGEKYVPEFGSRVGCAFRLELQTEGASRNPRLEWDTLSGTAINRKLRPRISLQSGMPVPAEPSGGQFIPELTLCVGLGFWMEPLRKLRSSLSVYSGMRFPLGGDCGKRVPF